MAEIVTVEGVVEEILDKRSSGGKPYQLVRLEGEENGFFDWAKAAKKAGIKRGDVVSMEIEDGDYPRIESIRIGGGAKSAPARPATAADQLRQSRDERIARESVLKSAAQLVASHSDTMRKPLNNLADDVTALATVLFDWVMATRDDIDYSQPERLQTTPAPIAADTEAARKELGDKLWAMSGQKPERARELCANYSGCPDIRKMTASQIQAALSAILAEEAEAAQPLSDPIPF